MLGRTFLLYRFTLFFPMLFSTHEDVSYLCLSSYQAGGSPEAGPGQAAILQGPEVDWSLYLQIPKDSTETQAPSGVVGDLQSWNHRRGECSIRVESLEQGRNRAPDRWL